MRRGIRRAQSIPKADATKELCSRSLRKFIQRGWHVLEPGTPYVHGRVIDAMCEHLEAVTSGQIKRLLINVPPGTAKSLTTSVFWPAWEWGPRGLPHHRFVGFSYSERLSVRDNRRTRQLIQSEWFQRLWPLALADDQDAKMKFENEYRGWRQASSITGTGTGERGDRVIIDDPHAVSDADSPAKLERAIRWWHETLPTRVNSPEYSAIVAIMQRVHERDVSSAAKEAGFVCLTLPMEYEPSRRCETSIGFKDWRAEEGELLFPERYPAQVVEDLKRTLGSYATAAQLQQRPSPRGGGLIKLSEADIVDAAPLGGPVVRAWDFAATEEGAGSDPDYTAGVKATMVDGTCYVLDVQRGRVSPLERHRLVRATAQRDKERVPVLVPEDPGSAGKDVADRYRREVLLGFACYAQRVTGSKIQRADPFIAAAEAGNVKLVRGDWNQAFIDEGASFPYGAHDDQVDAAADAYLWLAQHQAVDAPLAAGPELESMSMDLGVPEVEMTW